MSRRFKGLLAGAVIAALAGTLAIGQNIVQNQLSGNECWNTGQGPGGPSFGWVCMYSARNGTALKTFSGSGVQTYTAQVTDSTLYWTGTAPTSWTITTPPSPFDGEILQIATDTTLTTLVTLTANSGQTLNTTYSAQTLSAKTSVEFQYSLATSKWYQMR